MEVLVIILSAFLALFLIVGIILGVLLIKVSIQIKRVTTKAEQVADNIGAVTANMRSATTAAFVTKLIKRQLNNLKKAKK